MAQSRICFPFLFGLLLVLCQCGDAPAPTPKPRGYPRVVYPDRHYVSLDDEACAFRFEYPDYMQVEEDTAFFDEKPLHPCWFNLYYPDFDSRLHFSYYPVGDTKSLERLSLDAFELMDWHKKRANYIDEVRIENPARDLYGFTFEIEGPAASSFQFYLTDSTRHFLRGALYFNTEARPDSLAPVTAFVQEDIDHMINTFSWAD